MDTKRLTIDTEGDWDAQVLAEAVALVEQGEIVAFPTETVYGLACRVETRALDQLDEVKGRSPEKHYTLHIGDETQFATYVPQACLKARKLAALAWPGPLTVVFELSEEQLAQQQAVVPEDVYRCLYSRGSIGVRWPNHPVALELLRRVRYPVVAPSANRSGEEPAINGEQAWATMNQHIPLVLDGGACPLQVSSTVVRVSPKGTQILREGAYSAAGIARYSHIQVLFVCTGNTCRSAMAEALCRVVLAEKLGCHVDDLLEMGYTISSAGTMNVAGMPASQGALNACAERGIDLRGHRSHGLSLTGIEESDLIMVMERSHRDAVLASFPEAADKCILVSPDGDIPDPIGQPMEVFRQCAERIKGAIAGRLKEYVL